MWSVYLSPSPIQRAVTRRLGVVSRRAYYGALAPLRTRQIGKPALPGRRWVRVRTISAGISGTDVALVRLQLDPRVSLAALPRHSRLYLGHEVVGEVVEVGPEAEFLRVGDRVTYQHDQCCATRDIEPPCRHCAVGNYGLCENRYLPGPTAIGGGWSDEIVLHERQLFLVPDNLSDEQAALLEPAAIAVHIALRHQPQPGDNVLIIGGGTIGLLTTQVVHALSPNTIITSLARYPVQVEMATRLGATRILYQEDGMAGVARHTGGQQFRRRFSGAELLIGGFDVVYDTIGSAETMSDALRWVRGGGVVVQAGPQMAFAALDLTPIWHQEITVLGATGHGTESWPGSTGFSSWGSEGGRVSSFALAAALIRDNRLTPHHLVTHRFPLREIRHALKVAQDKQAYRSIKVLLDMRNPGSAPLPAAALTMAKSAKG